MAIRMVLDGIIPPNGAKDFSDRTLGAIQDEIGYWNAGTVKVANSREWLPSAFPVPVDLYRLQKNGEGKEQWANFGQSLIDRGLADFGHAVVQNGLYTDHARGIEAVCCD